MAARKKKAGFWTNEHGIPAQDPEAAKPKPPPKTPPEKKVPPHKRKPNPHLVLPKPKAKKKAAARKKK